jgi:hypothetical protein
MISCRLCDGPLYGSNSDIHGSILEWKTPNRPSVVVCASCGQKAIKYGYKYRSDEGSDTKPIFIIDIKDYLDLAIIEHLARESQ